MNKDKPNKPIISETALQTDLKELAHALVRELAVACKKVAIYGPHHPQARKAVEKPFFILDELLSFKRYVNLRLQQGHLSLINIRLRETVFSNQLIQYMQFSDVAALYFERGISAVDFSFFIESFATARHTGQAGQSITHQLNNKKIEKIQCNSELAYQLFDNYRQYRGDVDGDFSVRKLILDQLPENLAGLVAISTADDSELIKAGIDFMPDLIEYILPEKIGSLSVTDIRSELKSHSVELKDSSDEPDLKSKTGKLVNMLGLLQCHTDHAALVEQLDDDLKDRFKQFEELGDPSSATGRIRLELSQKTDLLLSNHFRGVVSHKGDEQSEPTQQPAATEFSDALLRLTKTGQKVHAEEVMNFLLDRLADINPHFRQHALEILIDLAGRLHLPVQYEFAHALTVSIAKRLNNYSETYEYSELISILYEKYLSTRQFGLIAEISGALAARRHCSQGVTVFDSMAVKKSLTSMSRTESIDLLVKELAESDFDTTTLVRQILTDIGSEEVALALSEIISHPIRQVRQQSLRILAESGKAALMVFSQLLMDDSWFEREAGRHELPDSKWYVLRNSIFVLGSLKDEEAIAPLRLRMSDRDVRIRREVVTSLEKIGGEEAVDLLIMMADDSENEISEKALRTVGLIGQPECVPLLQDVASRKPDLSVIVIWAISKIGGAEALAYLTKLLDDPQSMAKLAGGKTSREEVRLAVIKALGRLGDSRAIETIKGFQASLSTTQKLFFKNSPLQKTITDILQKK